MSENNNSNYKKVVSDLVSAEIFQDLDIYFELSSQRTGRIPVRNNDSEITLRNHSEEFQQYLSLLSTKKISKTNISESAKNKFLNRYAFLKQKQDSLSKEEKDYLHFLSNILDK